MDAFIKKLKVVTERDSYEITVGKDILHAVSYPDDVVNSDKIGLFASERVMDLHGSYIESAFRCISTDDIFLMQDGEEYKNYQYAEDYFSKLLKGGFTRHSCLIAVGGGVVGDFAGYLAASYMRGFKVVHIPTTLLAMVDSSIGGKVAVNISAGKNIIGAFHQPRTVISDTVFLGTLPEKELRNGITETVKHALIGQAELLSLLLKHDITSIKKDEVMAETVYLSAGFKVSVVSRDEKESGLRAILNFGHTVGHAIESFLEYRGISHGEAVALGLKAAMNISLKMGFINREDMELYTDLVRRYQLISGGYSFPPETIMEHMKYDKKNVAGTINFVLLEGIGHPVYNQKVDPVLLSEVIKEL